LINLKSYFNAFPSSGCLRNNSFFLSFFISEIIIASRGNQHLYLRVARKDTRCRRFKAVEKLRDNEGNKFSAEILRTKFPYVDLSFRRIRISDSRISKWICLWQTCCICKIASYIVTDVYRASDCMAEKKEKKRDENDNDNCDNSTPFHPIHLSRGASLLFS